MSVQPRRRMADILSGLSRAAACAHTRTRASMGLPVHPVCWAYHSLTEKRLTTSHASAAILSQLCGPIRRLRACCTLKTNQQILQPGARTSCETFDTSANFPTSEEFMLHAGICGRRACFGVRLLRERAMMQSSHPPTCASARCGYARRSHRLCSKQAQFWPVRTHPACCSNSTCIEGHACRAGSFRAGAHREAGQGLAGGEVVGGGHVTQEDGVAGGQVLEGHAHRQLASQRPVQQVRVG